jgi:hypothetical protein
MTAVNALHRGLVILRALNDGHAQLRGPKLMVQFGCF